jgi:SHOCT-like domain
MVDENERRLVLEMIQSGKISADEGLRLLKALAESGDKPLEDTHDQAAITQDGPTSLPSGSEAIPKVEATQVAQPEPLDSEQAGVNDPESAPPQITHAPELPPDAGSWRSGWMVPLWVGVGILVLSGWLMYWAQITYGIGFLFFCAWLPFLLGLGLMVLAWQSRTAHWLHLRVLQKPGDWPRKIAISFPLPVGLASWFLRTFRGRIPGLEDPTVDQVLVALDQHTSPENPIYIEVEDNPNGQHVQIFIG